MGGPRRGPGGTRCHAPRAAARPRHRPDVALHLGGDAGLGRSDCGRRELPVIVRRRIITSANSVPPCGPCRKAICTSRPSSASARTFFGRYAPPTMSRIRFRPARVAQDLNPVLAAVIHRDFGPQIAAGPAFLLGPCGGEHPRNPLQRRSGSRWCRCPDDPPWTRNRSPPRRPPRITTFDQTVKQVSGRQARCAGSAPWHRQGVVGVRHAVLGITAARRQRTDRRRLLPSTVSRPRPTAATCPDTSSPGRGEAPGGGA